MKCVIDTFGRLIIARMHECLRDIRFGLARQTSCFLVIYVPWMNNLSFLRSIYHQLDQFKHLGQHVIIIQIAKYLTYKYITQI